MVEHKYDVFDAIISLFLIFAFLIEVWGNSNPYNIIITGTACCIGSLIWMIVRLIGDIIDG